MVFPYCIMLPSLSFNLVLVIFLLVWLSKHDTCLRKDCKLVVLSLLVVFTFKMASSRFSAASEFWLRSSFCQLSRITWIWRWLRTLAPRALWRSWCEGCSSKNLAKPNIIKCSLKAFAVTKDGDQKISNIWCCSLYVCTWPFTRWPFKWGESHFLINDNR